MVLQTIAIPYDTTAIDIIASISLGDDTVVPLGFEPRICSVKVTIASWNH